MFGNIASSYLVAEITETGATSYFDSVRIYDNVQISRSDLKIEGWRCLNLCFIEQSYLTFFADNYDSLFSLYKVQAYILKVDITYFRISNCIITNQSGFISAFYSDILMKNTSFIDSQIEENVFEIIETNITVEDCEVSNIRKLNPQTWSIFYTDKDSIVIIKKSAFFNFDFPFLSALTSSMSFENSFLKNVSISNNEHLFFV